MANIIQVKKIGANGTEVTIGVTPEALQAQLASGQVYMQSEPAATALAGPVLGWLAKAAIVLPPPWGQVASLALFAASNGVEGTRNLMRTALVASAAYLPLNVSERVATRLQEAPAWLLGDAAQDKFVQFISELPDLQRIPAKGALMGLAPSFNLECHTRFADAVYKICLDEKATDWQAAVVAYACCQNVYPKPMGNGVVSGKIASYFAIVAKGTGVPQSSGVAPAWKKRVQMSGGLLVDATTGANVIAAAKEGGGAAMLAAALAIGAAVLFH